MKKFITAIVAGMFLVTLQGPIQAQKEVEPPAIPPMLEDKAPLAQPEPREGQAPAKVQEQKAKRTTKTRVSKKKGNGQSSLKKKGLAKKTVIGKKKRSKASKKKGVTAKPKQRKVRNNTG
jgi:hypothetical protein